jgi:hypothetical protein
LAHDYELEGFIASLGGIFNRRTLRLVSAIVAIKKRKIEP